MTGQIVSVGSNGFLIQAGSGCGYLNVITTGATIVANGQSVKSGVYAEAIGTGSCATQLTATTVSLASSANGPFPMPSSSPAPTPTATPSATPAPSATPSGFYVTGQIVNVSSSGFLIQAGTGCGYLNVATSSSTTWYKNNLSAAAGTYARAWGSGSCDTSLTATAVSLASSASGPFTTGGTSPTSTPAPIATMAPTSAPAPVAPAPVNGSVRTRIKAYTEHFCPQGGCYQGGTSASASQVAQWADYVEPLSATSSTVSQLRSAGVPHVLVYTDPYLMYVGQSNTPTDRGQSSDYLGSNGSGADYWNVASSSTRSYEASQLSAAASSVGATGVFTDDTANGYDQYGSFSPVSGAYSSASQAESASEALWSALGSADVVMNGLGLAPDDGNTDGIQQALIANAPANVLGAVYEGCYLPGGADHDTNGRSDTTRWLSTENSQLQTQAAGKDFICLTLPQNGNNAGDRIYAYASLLLAYDANHTVYWNNMASATNTNIFPENAIVPTQPLVAAPSNVSGLAKGSVYVREYAACYNHGTLVGKCAVVVNPNGGSASIPVSGYSHALSVSGDDVFSGGTISTNASAPSSLGGVSAAILFQ